MLIYNTFTREATQYYVCMVGKNFKQIIIIISANLLINKKINTLQAETNYLYNINVKILYRIYYMINVTYLTTLHFILVTMYPATITITVSYNSIYVKSFKQI